MAKLSDLLAQQEKLKQQIVDASQEEVAEIKERLEAISSATGQSVSELLGLSTVPAAKKNKPTADKDSQMLTEWRTTKLGKGYVDPQGKTYIVKDKGRLPAWLVEAVKSGKLK
ncbi:H-NS family nucleoid-associated regulatory protein [Paracoccus marcusii]|uniref:H-NS family nucleoid-associated regulatory protein n=1 Tax=Paracoccus marcusii TaxID=59779 RepID=A0ABY7UNS5_9RHOB|nr:H-NS family nucleoid-associated regulatory protein [Paracoccus marcusii]WDA11585.1 H-NS family nucleoid-associated regulatory protein [Paracoccus marcusii]